MVTMEIQVSKLRQTLVLGCFMLLPQQLLVILRHGHFDVGSFIAGALGVAIAAVFMAPQNARKASISLQDETLSGPSRWGMSRVQIPLSELDRERSARRGIFGGRTLWSRSGEAVHVSALLIPRHRRDVLLRTLSLA